MTPLFTPYIANVTFLLTRPSRDVTTVMRHTPVERQISTHTSLAGRDAKQKAEKADKKISTHTSLAGRDETGAFFMQKNDRFLLTRPSRDVTFRRSEAA